ncbi:MAG: hypothetical protein NTU62_09525 [Spirochaetes bacterium]|nr:hypothetical protein [Spirochaetota bacterium]
MVRVSTIILAVLLVLLASYEIVVLFVPTMVLEGDFKAMTGKSYQEVLGPDAVRVSLMQIRYMAVIEMTAIASGFFILFAGFRREEKWAWFAMLILGAAGCGFGTVQNLVVGNMSDFTIFLVSLVAFMVALFLPIRRFFAKRT